MPGYLMAKFDIKTGNITRGTLYSDFLFLGEASKILKEKKLRLNKIIPVRRQSLGKCTKCVK